MLEKDIDFMSSKLVPRDHLNKAPPGRQINGYQEERVAGATLWAILKITHQRQSSVMYRYKNRSFSRRSILCINIDVRGERDTDGPPMVEDGACRPSNYGYTGPEKARRCS